MHHSPTIAALELRDYFWLQYRPCSGDEKPWRRIECAGIRIAESIGFMLGDYSHETRVTAAKRVRRAARECVKLIPTLQAAAPWTLDIARSFEILADGVLADLESAAPGTLQQ